MYKRILFFTIISLSIIGCKKDPGAVLPVDQLDNSNYPKTLADLQTILVPGYSDFRSFALYGRQYLPLLLSNDHTFCSTADGNTFRSIGAQFLTNSVTPANNPNAQLYTFLYQGVSSMNLFLDRADYYLNAVNKDLEHVNPLKGQALFLRAYYLFQLECIYGEQYIDMTQPRDPNILGVPLPIHFATTFSQANLPRSSAYDVWSRIIADFKQSAQYLQGVTYAATDEGRVTQWAAEGMLGKAYVFTKQYDSARKYLSDVINNSGKSLMPFSQYQNAFNGNIANKFNQESLFELNVDRQTNLPNATFNSFTQSLTTNQGVTFAPTIIGAGGEDGNGPGSQNMGGSYVQYFVHDKNLKRFGFTIPPYSLETNPAFTSTSTATTPQFIMDDASSQYSKNVRANKTVDPRLFVCALEPWVDSVEQPYIAGLPGANPANVPDTIPVGKAYIISAAPNIRANYWGWSFKKYATIDNSLAAYSYNDGANIYLLRLADIYLLYAEANATSDPATALHYINLVHERAYGNSSSDYSSLSSPTMAKGANDELANDPLKYERYVELFGEGGWYFDVCRWGIGNQEAAYYVYGTADYDPGSNTGPASCLIDAGAWQGSGSNIAAAHFPLPLQEIQSNPAIQRNNYPY